MYKRILVAVDGSNTSRRAFEAALSLASSQGAELQPFYVVENSPMYFDAPGYDPSILRDRLIEQGKELGNELTQAMRAKGVAGELAVGEAAHRRRVGGRPESRRRIQRGSARHGHARPPWGSTAFPRQRRRTVCPAGRVAGPAHPLGRGPAGAERRSRRLRRLCATTRRMKSRGGSWLRAATKRKQA